MLLLLLSFYVHYDLLNCEEIVKAKFNESSLVDYHRRVLVQANSLLQDILEQKTNQSSMFNADEINDITMEDFIYQNTPSVPRSGTSEIDQNNQSIKNTTEPPPVNRPSPQYVPYDPHQDPPLIFPSSRAPPSVMPPDPIGLVKNPDVITELHYPGHQLIPMNSIYPGLMMPHSIFSENISSHYMTNYSYPLHTMFRPREQGIYKRPPLLGHFHLIPFHPIYAPPPSSPSFYVSDYTPLHDSTLTTTRRTTTMGENAKIWLQEIAPYTRVKKKKKNKSSEDHSRPWDRTTEPIPPSMTEPRNYWSTTGTANTAPLLNNDDYEFLHVALTKLNRSGMSTIAGDVLYGKIKVRKPSTTQAPEQRHLDLMEQLEEGYLMVFALEMFRLIAVKVKREVQEVLAPLKPIFNNLLESGRLSWIEDPLQIFIEKLSTVASSGGDNIDILRTYSSMMFHSLLKRKEVLSPEVNSIIDQAELFYTDEEGKRLLRSLSQFEDYPNTTKASYWICESLIENILQPFRRPSVSRSRERLLDSVNRALRRRFPLLTRQRIWPKFGTNPSEIKRHKKKRKRIRYLQ